MKLLAKFSLMFVIVFGLGLSAAGYFCHTLLQEHARQHVEDGASIMMETALAMRRYTSAQIKPAFDKTSINLSAMSAAEVEQYLLKPADSGPNTAAFHRETVPAFAATEMFGFLREKYPDYFYKEAASNPTNPRDRAEAWEADILNYFRNHPDLKTFAGERQTPMGKSLYLARPIRAAAACLECHSTPSAAPAQMIAIYGSANGFGWKENDVIAAQIVSVPVALAEGLAKAEFRQLMTLLVAVGAVTLLVLNVVLVLTVIRPVGLLANRAEEISAGNLDVPELPSHGKSEISMLVRSFNRMHRSLLAAMKLLDKE
jgi:HAMP domain-containing protein